MTTSPIVELGTVHHVTFRVDDLDQALEFYAGGLGLTSVPGRPQDAGTRRAWLRSGSTQVCLVEAEANDDVGRAPTELTNRACHVAFNVNDLEAAERSLQAAGFEYLRGTEVEQLVMRDPSGNIVELTPYGG